jgi:hypothetical protein
VANDPTNAIDPNGLETPTASKGLPPGGAAVPGYYHECDKKAPIVINTKAFRAKAALNNVDPKIVRQILDATIGTSKPWTINPCKKWAETAFGKMPPMKPTGEIIGAKKVYVSIVAWTFKPCFRNLWCLFVDGHFAIQVKLPDGSVFYFDDGDWGGAFTEKNIPDYAK